MKRTRTYALGALLCALALSVPTVGWAATGGAGVPSGGAPAGGGSSPGSGQSSPGSGQSSPQASPATATVSTSGDGITLQTLSDAILRRGITFQGTAPTGMAGDTIVIQRSGHQTGWRWTPTASATIASTGSFSTLWSADHIGRFAIRAVVSAPSGQAQPRAQVANATPSLSTTVYRPSLATQYGPGFYGHRTACGQRLRRGTVGVASRTLKCGTSVAILYNGRAIVVPVIDRGPYANRADWDLTMATGHALGIPGTAEIAAVSLPQR